MVGALALTVFLLGCSSPTGSTLPPGDNPAPGTSSPSQPRGTFTYGASSLTPSVDPALSTNGTARKYELFETLTYADATSQIQPMLATKWESIDATSWRFTLRDGAKFQDGSPLTAKDVVFSWTRAQDPALKSHIPGNMATIESVTAEGTSAILVKTKQVDPILPRRFFFLAILPQAAMEKAGDQAFFVAPIGSGPFKFKEFIPDNSMTLTAWTEHPYRKAKVNELVVRLVPEASARLNGLRTGDLDAAMQIPLDSIASLKSEGFQSQANNLSNLILIFETWGTNGTDAGPIANREVRLAMNYAIDREGIAKSIWHGLTEPAKGVLSKGVFGYDSTITGYPYDPAKAKQLLAQAGYPNGFKTVLEFQNTGTEVQSTLLAVQANLKAIGIDAELSPVDGPTLIDKIYKRKPPAAMVAANSSPAPLYDGDGQFTFFASDNRFAKRFSSPAYDAKYTAQLQELDPTRREAILKELGRLTLEDPPLISLVGNTVLTVWNKSVSVQSIGADNVPFFDTVEKR